jgi:hypothetical protein
LGSLRDSGYGSAANLRLLLGRLIAEKGQVSNVMKLADYKGMSPEELRAFLPPIAGGGVEDLNVFDIYQQAAITDLVRRNLETVLETEPGIGAGIAPLFPVYDRQIKREVAEVAAFGIGQFRAPDASPKIFAPRINYTQEVTDLLLLDEMVEIKEDLWLRMTSPTPAIRARAGVDVVTQGRQLQMRNERLTEVMRWAAFKGQPIVVNFDPSGAGAATQSITITYNYLGTHKPSASVPWTDRVNATPIDDLRAWQLIIANDAGVFGSKIHMNSTTYQYLQRSNQARGYLTPTDRNLALPKKEDIESLLWVPGSGTAVVASPEIIVTDAGYRDETQNYNRGLGAVTRYLQNGEVLITTEYKFEGENIADVADGMVALTQDFQTLRWAQGMQSEIMLNHQTKTHFFRQASARFVRLRRPQAFLCGKAF